MNSRLTLFSILTLLCASALAAGLAITATDFGGSAAGGTNSSLACNSTFAPIVITTSGNYTFTNVSAGAFRPPNNAPCIIIDANDTVVNFNNVIIHGDNGYGGSVPLILVNSTAPYNKKFNITIENVRLIHGATGIKVNASINGTNFSNGLTIRGVSFVNLSIGVYLNASELSYLNISSNTFYNSSTAAIDTPFPSGFPSLALNHSWIEYNNFSYHNSSNTSNFEAVIFINNATNLTIIHNNFTYTNGTVLAFKNLTGSNVSGNNFTKLTCYKADCHMIRLIPEVQFTGLKNTISDNYFYDDRMQQGANVRVHAIFTNVTNNTIYRNTILNFTFGVYSFDNNTHTNITSNTINGSNQSIYAQSANCFVDRNIFTDPNPNQNAVDAISCDHGTISNNNFSVTGAAGGSPGAINLTFGVGLNVFGNRITTSGANWLFGIFMNATNSSNFSQNLLVNVSNATKWFSTTGNILSHSNFTNILHSQFMVENAIATLFNNTANYSNVTFTGGNTNSNLTVTHPINVTVLDGSAGTPFNGTSGGVTVTMKNNSGTIFVSTTALNGTGSVLFNVTTYTIFATSATWANLNHTAHTVLAAVSGYDTGSSSADMQPGVLLNTKQFNLSLTLTSSSGGGASDGGGGGGTGGDDKLPGTGGDAKPGGEPISDQPKPIIDVTNNTIWHPGPNVTNKTNQTGKGKDLPLPIVIDPLWGIGLIIILIILALIAASMRKG